MTNDDIPRNAKTCCKTKRPFRPGETIVSVLVEENGEYKRSDYSLDAWNETEKPTNSLGVWKTRIESENDKKIKQAPNDILWNLFDRLTDQPDKADVRFVLTLLMIRRRIFRLEPQKPEGDPGQIVVFAGRRETAYSVPVVDLNDEQKEKVQNYLASLLSPSGRRSETNERPDVDRSFSDGDANVSL